MNKHQDELLYVFTVPLERVSQYCSCVTHVLLVLENKRVWRHLEDVKRPYKMSYEVNRYLFLYFVHVQTEFIHEVDIRSVILIRVLSQEL